MQDHVQAAPVIIDNNPFRRNLGHGRELQVGTQSISFQGSVFTNNEQRDPPALFTYGVITVTSENNALIIDDCEFTDNTYDEDFGVSVERNVWRLPDYLQRSQSFFFLESLARMSSGALAALSK